MTETIRFKERDIPVTTIFPKDYVIVDWQFDFPKGYIPICINFYQDWKDQKEIQESWRAFKCATVEDADALMLMSYIHKAPTNENLRTTRKHCHEEYQKEKITRAIQVAKAITFK